MFKKLLRLVLIAIVLMVMLVPMGCKKNEPETDQPAKPLFLTQWGAGYEEITGQENGQIVSDKRDFLIYKKTLRDYPLYITYEFNQNKLIRVFLNVNAKNSNEWANDALIEYFEIMITNNLGPSRYIVGDNLLFMGQTTLSEMQVIQSRGGVKAKISFFDVNYPQNKSFVDGFEKAWSAQRHPQGTVQ